MRLYPELPRRRTATLATDAAVLLAVVLFAWLGMKAHDVVLDLRAVPHGVQSVGSSVEGALDDAGEAAGGAPVVGGSIKDALQSAGRGTGGEAASAGRSGERAVGRVANLAGWLTFGLPTLLLVTRWLPPRAAQVGRLTAAHRVLREPADGERRALLAQRAAFGLPYATLLRHTRDPLGDLAAGRLDPLVAAVREDAGLRAP